jgi:hypothetical protein
MKGRLQILRTKVSSHTGWKWFILSTVLLGATMSLLAVQSAPAHSGNYLTDQDQIVSVTQKLALAYYAKKYNDSDVDINVVPHEDYMEADVRKNGDLIKKLTIKGCSVTEQGTGMRDWTFNLLTNVN